MGLDLYTTQELTQQGFTHLQLSCKDLIDTIVDGAMKLFTDKEKYLPEWTFDHTEPGDPDTGFFERTGAPSKHGRMDDRKLIFHMRQSLLSKLIQRGVDYRDEFEWLKACHRLFCRCKETVLLANAHIADQLGIPELKSAFTFNPDNDDHVLRILGYTGSCPQSTSSFAGKRHTDRGGWTLHIAESSPGLFVYYPSASEVASLEPEKVSQNILFPETQYKAVSPKENAPILFAGEKVQKLTDARIRALDHGIKQLVPLNHKTIWRWVIVFFAHPNPIP